MTDMEERYGKKDIILKDYTQYTVSTVSDIRPKYLRTSFYSTIEDDNPDHPQHINSFTPYDIFCLNTKLLPYLEDLLELSGIGIEYDYVHEDSRLNQIIKLTYQGEKYDMNLICNEKMSKIQDRINEETSRRPDYCLLIQTDKLELKYKKYYIDSSWILHMIPLLEIHPNYYGSYEIDESNGIGYLYLNLRSEKVYSDFYDDITMDVNQQLLNFYREGYVLGAHNLEESWNLEKISTPIKQRDDIGDLAIIEGVTYIPVNNDLSIYKPLWNNLKLTQDRVLFLQSLIKDSNRIKIKVPNGCNEVIQYFIVRELYKKDKEVIFDENHVYISPVSGIEEANKLACIIYDNGDYVGNVLRITTNSQEMAYYYSNLMKTYLTYIPDCPPLIYRITESEFPFVAIAMIEERQNSRDLKKMFLE